MGALGRRIRIAAAAVLAACTASEPGSGAVASLRFATQPAGVTAGHGVDVSVELLDANGDRARSANDPVTLALGFGAAVRNPVVEPASRGLATFSAFPVTQAAEAQVLEASARGLSVVSLPFAVRAGPVAADHSVVTASAPVLSNTPRALSFTFADAFGNPIPRATVNLASDAAGSTFSPASGLTTAQGTFQSQFRAPTPGSVRLSATVAGTLVTLPSPLVVADACAPAPVTLPWTSNGVLAQGEGCVVDGQPLSVNRFTTTGAGGVAVTISPSFTSRFEIRSDPALPSVWRLANATATVEWLLPAGTYEFRLSSVSGSGAYAVSAAAAPANAGQVIRLIASPGTFTGQALTTTDVDDGFAYADYFLAYSTRPCTITVRSTTFDPFVLLGNATFGGLIDSDDNLGGGTDAQLVRPSCAASSGPVIIGVTSLYQASVGAYALSVSFDGPATIRAIASPAAIPAPLNRQALVELSRAARLPLRPHRN